MIKSKKIGDFDLNPIGIGTYKMCCGIYRDGEAYIPFLEYGDEEKHIEAIKYSLSKGQNHIDTAFNYGLGYVEKLIGKAIKDFDRNKIFIASKIWRSHLKRKSVVFGIKEMLERLQTDYLDLVYVHAPFTDEPMEDYIGGLNDAFDQGLIKNIGVSNFNLEQLKEAVIMSKNPITATQFRYNLLEKQNATAEHLEFCKENNILVIAHSPVQKGVLTQKEANPTLSKIAEKYRKTPVQVALNWLISQENVVAIPKASSKNHIDENFAALDFELSKEDLEELSSL